MARPTKKGLEYFSLDVSFYWDIKVRKLVRRKGGKSLTVYIILLCLIYENGYFLSWDDDLPFIISEVSGFEEDTIIDIINYCVEVGLFNKDMYERDGVLTSHSIQERYKSACSMTKRRLSPDLPYQLIPLSQPSITGKSSRISGEQSLVFSEETPISSEETAVNSEETPIPSEETKVNSGKSTQRKEKKKKKNNIPPNPPSGGQGLTTDSDVVVQGDVEGEEGTVFCNPAGYEKFDLSYIDEPYREAFFRWLEYKRADQSFKYRSEKSIRTCYNSLVKLSGSDSQKAMLIVEQSITNGWKGLFSLQQNNHGADNNNGYRSGEDIINGAVGIISQLRSEGQQPPAELPVV